MDINKIPQFANLNKDIANMENILTENRSVVGNAILNKLNSILNDKVAFIFCDVSVNKISKTIGSNRVIEFGYFLIDDTDICLNETYTMLYLKDYATNMFPSIAGKWYFKLTITIDQEDIKFNLTPSVYHLKTSMSDLTDEKGRLVYNLISNLYNNIQPLTAFIKDLNFNITLVNEYLTKIRFSDNCEYELCNSLLDHRKNVIENICISALNRKINLVEKIRSTITTTKITSVSRSTNKQNGFRINHGLIYTIFSNDIAQALKNNYHIMYGIAR